LAARAAEAHYNARAISEVYPDALFNQKILCD
jgi:hypothetical protein